MRNPAQKRSRSAEMGSRWAAVVDILSQKEEEALGEITGLIFDSPEGLTRISAEKIVVVGGPISWPIVFQSTDEGTQPTSTPSVRGA